jgi:predicted RNA-binding Zn ribbon-like protein
MSITAALQRAQDAGFPMGGEPSVAIDLVDTLMRAVTPAVDLLEGKETTWWELQAGRVPHGPAPESMPTRRLRAALREALEARIDDGVPDPATVEELNAFADSVPSSPRLVVAGGDLRVDTRWHREHGGDPRLAAVARDGIALLADPERSAQLRRCASPTCSMLFLAENNRRIWCTPNICGNRTRVARHQQRHHAD